MIIKKLELYKFKRFFLSQVDHFVLEPKSNIMIMAWGNGKGKSSLLSVLNPLPAELKRDFKEDGYKYIEILHRGHEYKLSSGKIEKGKHSFIYDDVELNPGGTKKVQLELVNEHFNLTPAINQVVLGVDRFSAMSPSARKEWFSKLSTIDYSFPIRVYNNLKSRHRDITGGIKLTQDTIVKLTSNVVTEEELASIQEQRTKLEEYITHIVSLYEHNNVTSNDANVKELAELKPATEELRTLLAIDLPSYNIDYYTEAIVSTGNKITTLESDIKSINEKISLLDNSSNVYGDDIDKINMIRKETLTRMCALRKNKLLPINLNKVRQITSAYYSIYNDLVKHANLLLDLERIPVTLSLIEETKVKVEALTNRLVLLEKKINNLQGEIDGLEKYNKDEDMVICPQCQSRFHVHYKPDKSKLLRSDLAETRKNKELLEQERHREQSKLDLMLSIKEHIVSIKQSVERYDILKPISNIFNTEIDLNTTTHQILSLIDSTKINLDHMVSYQDDIKTIKDLHNDRVRILAINSIKHQMHLDSILVLEKELETKTIELNNLRKELITITGQRDKLMKIRSLESKVKNILKSSKYLFKRKYNELRNAHLNELVTELKAILVEYDQRLMQNVQARAQIDICNKTIEEYKTREAVLNKMLSALSPTDGIIAKSINSFLNIFIKEMNHIINSVWSYEMKLLACDITEDNDLDYKFKVLVNNDEVIEDVSKLSSSMQEIVDLAYKIVFMKYMHIADTPLILDEFGRTMDEVHRDTAYNIIDRIFTTNFEQIFLVSHFESMYGRFVNADIVELEEAV